jgi:hypothetical protein
MRGRQRHFNARDAGASLVLDSRFVPGFSDDALVTTWPDRSRNGYSPTRSTDANKPKFKVGGSGGQPTIRFDGNDSLYYAANITPNVGVTMLAVCKFDSATARSGLFDAKNYAASTKSMAIEANTFLTAGSKLGLYVRGSSFDSDFAATTNPVIIALDADTTSGGAIASNTNYAVNGAPRTLTIRNNYQGGTYESMTGVSGFMVGSLHSNGTPIGSSHDGDIYLIAVIPDRASTPLRKRIENAAAISFKIPCN